MEVTTNCRVLVLFGGVSSEHEVSRMSACSILSNLDRERFTPITVGITKDGRWLHTTAAPTAIRDGSWEQEPGLCPAILSPDRSHKGLLLLDPSGTTTLPVDLVFPVLHGKNGEDGTIQGLCELCGIPYVGCGVLASAVCMDKEFTHLLLSKAGIATAQFVTVYREEPIDAILSRLTAAGVSFPVFVKPANAGSSVGVSKANNAQDLSAALALGFLHDHKVLIEETLVGKEVECAVLGNRQPIAAGSIGEIEPLRALYDYEGKYCDDTTRLHIPARVSGEIALEVRRVAVEAYRLLGCRGLCRVDFFVLEPSGKVVLNELNTLPGFTDISMYPKLFCHDGISYAALLTRLIECGLNQKEER